jgi:hypothetical protein
MSIHGYVGNVITANPTAPTSSVATGVWTTEQQLIAVAAGNWPLPGPPQPISRSLRFNSADSAELNRTFGTPTNNKIFTISAWVKATNPSTTLLDFSLLAVGDAGIIGIAGVGAFGATYNNRIFIRNGGVTGDYWLPVFRDVSAWYHFVIAIDTTQATQADRAKLWVNGVSQAANKGASTLALNASMSINAASTTHYIGGRGAASYYANGYLTEYYFIDGQALTPSSFGQTNASTGVWEPIAYAGTYGTNGFYVNFSDNSNTTAATLGKDYSGNGNNWTPNNFSVTAGAGNDSMVDSPTAYGTDTGIGGEVRGNYATLNPLQKTPDITTVNNGNLFASLSGGFYNFYGILATQSAVTQKSYFEANFTANRTTASNLIGVIDWVSETNKALIQTSGGTGSYFSSAWAHGAGNYVRTGSTSTTDGVTYISTDTLMVAFDPVAGKVWFGKNGTWNSSSDPATNTGGLTISGYSGAGLFPYCTFNPDASTDSSTFNFGQRAFAYTAPSGFKALCTTNLPTPTIGATSTTLAGNYFNPVLYTGTGIARSVTGVGFQPDFVWIKARSAAENHQLQDAVRGATRRLFSNLTDAESISATSLTSFDSNGFSVGIDGNYNGNGTTFVSWNWNAGGSTVTNTSGTISAQVRANTTAGFSIVTATAPSAAAQGTVGHGLGVTPSMIIVKTRSTTYNWSVYHASVCDTTSKYLRLNDTSALLTYSTVWGAALPTSSVFGITGDGAAAPSGTFVAYCFAPVAGYSAFGSYTGNGSTDGPFVYLGFRPEFVMIKRTSAADNWVILDAVRSTANPTDEYLWANLSNAEVANLHAFDFLSNGFKIRNSTSDHNANGSTYIYACFAESPFKYALAR